MWSSGRSEAALTSALPVPIEIRPIRTARRMRLRFDEGAGILKLTCPPRTSRRAALSWALDQRDWIDAQVRRAPAAEPMEDGAVIPLEGERIRLEWVDGGARTPQLTACVLKCGGPQASFGRRIETYLKRRALETMSLEVREYAATAGACPAAVSVGDPASRWGSCSSQGRIRLSWRLILAPPHVRRYVVGHEVAHLVHLNHGPEFKALEAKLFGAGVATAKSDLRRLGPRLRRVGRRG
jgi:predicted metal-dependent hydrolase